MPTGVRTERDSLGTIEVPSWAYWGAQTQRALEHFAIGGDRFVWGRSMLEALGLVKRAAARANGRLGLLPEELAAAIVTAAGEIVDGTLDDHFPLGVWQTGSGTQTNMNANEVLANRANELLGSARGSNTPVHPNDHVNLGQSSNDVFPTVVHVAVVLELQRRLRPAIDVLESTLQAKADAFGDIVKVGRTHLQDATPLTLGQELGGWVAQIEAAQQGVERAEADVRKLAIGATAVGTGLNTSARFAPLVVDDLTTETGFGFAEAPDRFAAIAAHDALVALSASLRTMCSALMKVANDIRWLGSGPRAGLGELRLPANEPGSSIMPGKVNPTQVEALTMVVTQIYGNDATVAFAGSQGSFQLNTYKPVIAHNVLESITLLADACVSFERHCVRGLEPDRDRIAANLASSLMLVTALAPHIGYDKAAAIAHEANRTGSTLRHAAVTSGLLSAEQYDELVDPLAMTRPDP